MMPESTFYNRNLIVCQVKFKKFKKKGNASVVGSSNTNVSFIIPLFGKEGEGEIFPT